MDAVTSRPQPAGMDQRPDDTVVSGRRPVAPERSIATDVDSERLARYLERLGLPPASAARWACDLVSRARDANAPGTAGSPILAAIDEIAAWTQSLAAATGEPLALLLVRLREILGAQPATFLAPADAAPAIGAEGSGPGTVAPPAARVTVRVEPLGASPPRALASALQELRALGAGVRRFFAGP